MATVQKGSKIDLYKFVPVTLASASTANPDDADPKLTEAALKNVQAVNSLGKTVNGLAKVVVDIKKITLASLTAQQKALVKLPKPKYNKPAAQFSSFFTKMSTGKIPGFLESLLKLLGGLFKILVVRNIAEELGVGAEVFGILDKGRSLMDRSKQFALEQPDVELIPLVLPIIKGEVTLAAAIKKKLVIAN